MSTGTGDLHSAAVGSGAVADFDPHLYIGTSSWISCHVPYKKTAPTTNVASIPSAIPGRYVIADEHETAGACLTFLKDVFYADDELGKMVSEENVLKLFDEVATKSPTGANGAIFTPWLNGERTPVDDHTIRGGFHNLSLGTSRRDMVRAVYEGVAYNSRWLLDAVEQLLSQGVRIARIHRWRGELRDLVSDPRGRDRAQDPSGRPAGSCRRSRCGLPRSSGVGTDEGRRHRSSGSR